MRYLFMARDYIVLNFMNFHAGLARQMTVLVAFIVRIEINLELSRVRYAFYVAIF